MCVCVCRVSFLLARFGLVPVLFEFLEFPLDTVMFSFGFPLFGIEISQTIPMDLTGEFRCFHPLHLLNAETFPYTTLTRAVNDNHQEARTMHVPISRVLSCFRKNMVLALEYMCHARKKRAYDTIGSKSARRRLQQH